MVPGYDGSCGELDNQGYYVNGDGMELQYPVSISISFLIFGGCGLNSMSLTCSLCPMRKKEKFYFTIG